MAVSVATEIPSFNVNELLKLTIKGIKQGFDKLTNADLISPDFPTGGILVKDDGELAKIMQVGKGKLRVRAKVEIAGKNIIVKEVPVGKTVEGIINSITEADIYGISDVRDITGYRSNGLINIQCRSKNVVEKVLHILYQKNILQNNFSSNILVIENGMPNVLGVYDVLKRWVEWRRKVVEKKIKFNYDSIKDEMTILDYFIRLIHNNEWRDKYVDIAIHQDKVEASKYLKEIFEDIPEDTCTWINGRSISAFNNGGRYLNRYNDLMGMKNNYENWLKNIDKYIIDELRNYIKTKGKSFPRKTEITYKDYKFSVIRSHEMEDTSFCYYYLRKDNFLFKTRSTISEDGMVCKFSGVANSLIIGFDNFGRVIRIPGLEVPYGNEGLYIPKFLNVPDDPDHQYKVTYLTVCDGRSFYLLYRDGFIGKFNTGDFVDKKRTKVVLNGVPVAVHDVLLDVIEDKEMKPYIVFGSNSGKHLKVGIVETSNIEWKSRTSRNKVLTGTSGFDIKYYTMFEDFSEIEQIIKEPESFKGKLAMLRDKDLIVELNLKEGKYAV